MNKLQTVLNKIKPIGAFIDIDKIKQESLDLTNEVTQLGGIFSSPFVPADMQSKNIRTIRSKSGKLLSTLCLPEDFAHGDESAVKPLVVSMMFAGLMTVNALHTVSSTGIGPSQPMIVTAGIGLFAYKLLLSPTFLELAGMALLTGASVEIMNLTSTSFLGSIIAYSFPGAAVYLMNNVKNRIRAMRQRQQASAHLGDRGEKVGDANDPRTAQISKAIQNTSPFISFGKATGTMEKAGDLTAPDEGSDFGTTLDDFSMGVFMFGKSGTGKSYFLRWLCKCIMEATDKIGMLALDGKGGLPFDIQKILDGLVHPDHLKNFNIIDGISASQWKKIILDVNNANDVKGDNAIFAVSAGNLIFYTALAQEFMYKMGVRGIRWNLATRIDLMPKMFELGAPVTTDGVTTVGDNRIASILKQHKDYLTNDLISDTVKFIQSYQSESKQEFAESILSNANAWLSSFLQNEFIRPWVNCETSDINIKDVFIGKKFGVPLGDKFEDAGIIITQVIKSIVRNELQNRSENWKKEDESQTSVVLFQDECQKILNDTDIKNLPTDRSKGCINVMATQLFSSLVNKFGSQAAADEFIGAFSTIGALPTGDKMTHDYIKHLAGSIRSFKSKMPMGSPIDFGLTAEVLARNPDFDANHPLADHLKKTRSVFKFHHLQNGKMTETGIGFFSGLFGIFKGFLGGGESIGLATYESDANHSEVPALSDYDLRKLEQEQWAYFKVKRAGQWRQDLVKINGLGPDFK